MARAVMVLTLAVVPVVMAAAQFIFANCLRVGGGVGKAAEADRAWDTSSSLAAS